MHKRYLMFNLLPAYFIFASLACTLSGSGLSSETAHISAEPQNLEAEEYAVYSVAISDFIKTHEISNTISSIVIRDQTSGYESSPSGLDMLEVLKQEVPSTSKEVIEDYRSKNKQPIQLRDLFTLKTRPTLIPKKEGEYLSWPEFKAKYPHSQGTLDLSRVGFDSKMSEALVYVANACGSMCGEGYYVLLRRGGGGWEITRKRGLWQA